MWVSLALWTVLECCNERSAGSPTLNILKSALYCENGETERTRGKEEEGTLHLPTGHPPGLLPLFLRIRGTGESSAWHPALPSEHQLEAGASVALPQAAFLPRGGCQARLGHLPMSQGFISPWHSAGRPVVGLAGLKSPNKWVF